MGYFFLLYPVIYFLFKKFTGIHYFPSISAVITFFMVSFLGALLILNLGQLLLFKCLKYGHIMDIEEDLRFYFNRFMFPYLFPPHAPKYYTFPSILLYGVCLLDLFLERTFIVGKLLWVIISNPGLDKLWKLPGFYTTSQYPDYFYILLTSFPQLKVFFRKSMFENAFPLQVSIELSLLVIFLILFILIVYPLLLAIIYRIGKLIKKKLQRK